MRGDDVSQQSPGAKRSPSTPSRRRLHGLRQIRIPSTDSDGVASDTVALPAETGSLEEQSLEVELLARLDATDVKLEVPRRQSGLAY